MFIKFIMMLISGRRGGRLSLVGLKFKHCQLMHVRSSSDIK